jgi:hypothetical protein
MLCAPPIYVPADADAKVIEEKHAEMQRALERVRDIAEGWFTLREEERQRYREEFCRIADVKHSTERLPK